MENPKIVCTGPIDNAAIEILQPYGEIVIAPVFEEEALLSLIDGAIGLVVRGAEGSVNARVINAAADLRVIGRSGVGYDNVDISAATARNIPVVYTPGVNARAIAEAAMALIFTLCKKVVFWDAQLKLGNWSSRFRNQPGDLDGATLGIIGFGRIGQMLAQLIRPFNVTILAYDPYVSHERANELETELVDLESLLQRSDFISIHAALTPETQGLINRDRLQHVKPGAYIVNLARGGLIESLDVLYESLKSGRLGGVGLDVFQPEPPDVSHPIFQLPHCITSPHALGLTPQAMTKIFESMATDMAAILDGKPPRHVVNPEVLG